MTGSHDLELKWKVTLIAGGVVVVLVIFAAIGGYTYWGIQRGKRKQAADRKPCTVSLQCTPGTCFRNTPTHDEGRCYDPTERPVSGLRM